VVDARAQKMTKPAHLNGAIGATMHKDGWEDGMHSGIPSGDLCNDDVRAWITRDLYNRSNRGALEKQR